LSSRPGSFNTLLCEFDRLICHDFQPTQSSSEYCCPAKPSRRMFCPDSMVSRRLSRRSSAIRYRSILMGTESCRGGFGEGHVCCRLFPRGWNRDNTEHARVSVMKSMCLGPLYLCLGLITFCPSGLSRITSAQQNWGISVLHNVCGARRASLCTSREVQVRSFTEGQAMIPVRVARTRIASSCKAKSEAVLLLFEVDPTAPPRLTPAIFIWDCLQSISPSHFHFHCILNYYSHPMYPTTLIS